MKDIKAIIEGMDSIEITVPGPGFAMLSYIDKSYADTLKKMLEKSNEHLIVALSESAENGHITEKACDDLLDAALAELAEIAKSP